MGCEVVEGRGPYEEKAKERHYALCGNSVVLLFEFLGEASHKTFWDPQRKKPRGTGPKFSHNASLVGTPKRAGCANQCPTYKKPGVPSRLF